MALHAHVEDEQRDCDGPVSNTAVLTIREDEDEYDFRQRVLRNVASVYSAGMLEVSEFEDGTVRFSWRQRTEEGYHNREATLCEDEGCDPNETSRRDYYAEEMGY